MICKNDNFLIFSFSSMEALLLLL